MKETASNKTCRRKNLIIALGVTALVLLLLVSLASAAPFAYITNYGDNTVSVIDTATNKVTATVPVGYEPGAVAVSQDGTKVYLANEDKTVSVIDAATNKVISTVNIGEEPESITITPDGKKVYVAGPLSNTVFVINTVTNTITAKVTINSPGGVVASPDGTKVYITGNENGVNPGAVFVLDTSTNTVVATIPMAESGYSIAISPDGKNLYVPNYGERGNGFTYIIDTATNKVTSKVPVGDGSTQAAVSPDNKKAYVTNSWDSNVSVIDTATNKVTATVNVGGMPEGIAFTPDGKKAYVANEADNYVSVIDTTTDKVTATVHVGISPCAFGQFIAPSSISPVTISFNPQKVELFPGSSQNVQLVMDKVPANGLAGFNISVSVLDPTIASITAVSTPSWSGVSGNSTVPSNSVWITAANFGQVHPGDTNVSLGNITITGGKEGKTNLTIVPTEIDDNNGNLINPDITMCQVNMILIPPFPGCTNPPTDLNGDGLYEDINGNGRLDFADVVIYFNDMAWITQKGLVTYFDYNLNGRIDFSDVVKLFGMKSS